jgi:hypothetical protein
VYHALFMRARAPQAASRFEHLDERTQAAIEERFLRRTTGRMAYRGRTSTFWVAFEGLVAG